LILRKISKCDATRCQILRLKCTKFDFLCGCAPDPAGSLQRSPDPIAVFKGAYFYGEGEGRGREREGKRGWRKEGRGGASPLPIFWLRTAPE